MSSDQTGEKKTLQPSPKKLRDARKKGKVPRSRDLMMAASAAAGMIYLWLSWGETRRRLIDLIDLAAGSYDRPFEVAAANLMQASLAAAIAIVGPLFALVAGTMLCASTIVTRGFVFSTDQIKPKAGNLNPAQGLKKIFSLNNLFEFLKSIAKTLLLVAALWVLIQASLGSLLRAPLCGLDCVSSTFGSLLTAMMTAAAVVYFIAGGVDTLLQRYLFRREMRMTLTELKRERREDEGDPHIRRARRRLQRELTQSTTPIGVRHATLMISAGDTAVVGVHFVRGKTAVPVVVCKGRGPRVQTLMALAREQGTPALEDPELARQLADRVGVGRHIHRDLYGAVAKALSRVGTG